MKVRVKSKEEIVNDAMFGAIDFDEAYPDVYGKTYEAFQTEVEDLIEVVFENGKSIVHKKFFVGYDMSGNLIEDEVSEYAKLGINIEDSVCKPFNVKHGVYYEGMCETLNILGKEYKVVSVNDEEFMEKYDGDVDYASGIIRISSRLSKDSRKTTLIHEMVHAVANLVYPELNEDEDLINKISNIAFWIHRELSR